MEMSIKLLFVSTHNYPTLQKQEKLIMYYCSELCLENNLSQW